MYPALVLAQILVALRVFVYLNEREREKRNNKLYAKHLLV